jgi:hypothetical protein
VIQSELNGAYDSLALELANKTKLSQRHRDETHLVAGDFTTGTYITQYPVLLHLLIYKVVDGKMALSFVHFDNPGGNQNTYYGSPWIAVQKDGKWTKVFPK